MSDEELRENGIKVHEDKQLDTKTKIILSVETEMCTYWDTKSNRPTHTCHGCAEPDNHLSVMIDGKRYCLLNFDIAGEICRENVPDTNVGKNDRWIPVTERLPETTDPVNVTWANNDPVSYYEDIRGKRFTATACYHKGKWWWYSAVCQDLIDEYGKSCMDDEIDEAIEILAWRPLPEPYTAG